LLILAGAAGDPVVASSEGSGISRVSLRQSGSQPVGDCVWVFFTDKGLHSAQAVEHALAQIEAGYNRRAIERRRRRGMNSLRGGRLFDHRDLPVSDAYIDAVAATGVSVRQATKWLNAVSVIATPRQLNAISGLSCVDRIVPVVRMLRQRKAQCAPEPASQSHVPTARGLDYGVASDQLQLINVIALHEAGYTGEGVIIGSIDTGFARSHDAFNFPGHELDVVAEWDFVNDDGNTAPEVGDLSDQHEHGTLIIGGMGAYLPGQLIAGAPDASYILAKVEDVASEYWLEEDWFVAGLEFIEANGGDIATSSVVIFNHYAQSQLDGQTSVMTQGMNVATENGLITFQGVGNNGHDADPATSTLVPPADAFDTVTVGSADFSGASAWFTSDGPTADGRVKPELLAWGLNAYTVDAFGDRGFVTVNGASIATPQVAAATACILQAHPEWGVQEIRNALIQSAGGYVANAGAFDPLYIRGWGLVNAYEAAQDCNTNDSPDIWDIASGASPDNNSDGIPDECTECPADLTGDSVVDINDVFRILSAWGPCGLPCPPSCEGDINGDCTVDINDVFALLGAWGPCS